MAGARPAHGWEAPAGGGAGPAARKVAVSLLAVGVAGALLAYAAVQGVRGKFDNNVHQTLVSVEKRGCAGNVTAVRPVQVAASASLPAHPAQNLVDLVQNDYWAANATPQQLVTFTFATPTSIDYLHLTTGAGPDYTALARPKNVRFIYDNGSEEELQLKDDPKLTCYPLQAVNTTRIAMRILDVYPSEQSLGAAIAEMEFFKLT